MHRAQTFKTAGAGAGKMAAMPPTKDQTSALSSGDWLRRAAGPEHADGVERVEAFFRGAAYGAHRHDSYAIGVTMAGVQSFRYRAALRHSVAGRAVVLHPDEAHDGQAGTDAGFHYRIAYVAPELVQQILGGAALPHIDGGVSSDPRLVRAARMLLLDFATPPDPLAQQDALFDLATALQQAAPRTAVRPQPAKGDLRAVSLARDFIHDSLFRRAPDDVRLDGLTLDALAHAAGRDRWSLSRDFRFYLGTSPHRYVTMRRLALAKTLLAAGLAPAAAALQAGFADQSHLTRHFVAAFGMPPGRWLRLQRP